MLLKKLLHSKRREQIETILAKTVRSYLQDLINRQRSKPNLPLADAKVQCPPRALSAALSFIHTEREGMNARKAVLIVLGIVVLEVHYL